MNSITVETKDKTSIIHLQGRLDNSNSAEFEEAVRQSLEGGPGKVIMHMEKVGFMSSAALRVILILMKGAKAADAPVLVAAASDNINEIFRISGFQSVITSVPTLEEALR